MVEIKDPPSGSTPPTGKDQSAVDLPPKDPVREARERRQADLKRALTAINQNSLTTGVTLMLTRGYTRTQGWLHKTLLLAVTPETLSAEFDHRVADPVSPNFPEVSRAITTSVLDAFALRAHRESADQPHSVPSKIEGLIPIAGVCGENPEVIDTIGYHIRNFLPLIAPHPSQAPESEVEMWNSLKGLKRIIAENPRDRVAAFQIVYSLFSRIALAAAILEARGIKTNFFVNEGEANAYLDRFLESAVR